MQEAGSEHRKIESEELLKVFVVPSFLLDSWRFLISSFRSAIPQMRRPRKARGDAESREGPRAGI